MPYADPTIARAIEAQTRAMEAQMAVERLRGIRAEASARAMQAIAEGRRVRADRARTDIAHRLVV